MRYHFAIVLVATGVVIAGWFVLSSDEVGFEQQARPREAEVGALVPAVLTDGELRAALDHLLEAVDPEGIDNDYFPEFAREHLRWMVQEHAVARLEIAFLSENAPEQLPADVLMAARQAAGRSTIAVSKERFAAFLRESGGTTPPLTQRHKNDFAIALVHEIVHLRNPDANPHDPALRAAEESRAWQQVSIHVVRPLRAQNQPMHQRFKDVDDAFRACRDALPCPLLSGLVRLHL